MRKTKRFFQAGGQILAAFGMLVLLLLTLCSCFEPNPIVAVPATATPDVPTPAVEPSPTAKPRPEALVFPLAAPVHVGIERKIDEGCVNCHTDENALKTSLEESPAGIGALSLGADGAGESSSMEIWQKVLLDREAFFDTMHGRYGCIACHGGKGDTMLKEVAHQDMIFEPSVTGVCDTCHAEEVATDEDSLHTNLTGYRMVLFTRSDPSKGAQLETMMDNHCDTCHTASCGQCHVSRSARLGGGFVAGHLFKDVQAMNLTCVGCHESRIENEYKGYNRTVPGDVHWVQGKMLCSDCHVAAEFHGALESFVHRYDGQPTPDCQSGDCHPNVAEDDGIQQHRDSHLKNLSCQACHATTYMNCYDCHVGLEEGHAYSEVELAELAFKLGRNPIQDRYRPWKYVPVRHVPITPDSFSYYGENLLPNFDALPTWKYTTPHNIQRITPQNESCNSCHGNADVFLTAADVAVEELSANQRVIVEIVPTPVD